MFRTRADRHAYSSVTLALWGLGGEVAGHEPAERLTLSLCQIIATPTKQERTKTL
jgi:hypothetical protein